MKYVIWGAGERGRRIYYHLKSEDVSAFIESDEKKIGTEYHDKPVIDLSEYKDKHSDCYIIISNLSEKEVIDKLKENNINKYFLLSECPGELQEPFCRDFLKKYICQYVKKNKVYAIYGCTLYSIELCRWLEKELEKRVCIIPHMNMDETVLLNLKEDFLKDRISELGRCIGSQVNEILITVEDGMDYLNNYADSRVVMNNVYDCSDRIAEYYNSKLEMYRNRHACKRCFIVGTGPSLKIDDLDTLYQNNEICFSVNNIFRSFTDTKWRPDYYVVTDYEFLADGEKLVNVSESVKFISDCCQSFWEKNLDDSIIKFHTQYEWFKGRKPKFSNDFSRRSYLGGTVVFACLQLAVYMGFTEIYLLGVDCNYLKGSRSNYFYQQDAEDNSDHRVDHMISAYFSARDYADAHGIKIMNATRGGELEVYERVKFDALFYDKVQ
ncbi:MAG: DUF115 domain-containing protein [Ruminococcus flavefaciens]|nr:DUF115 domain-containing protein [Ruminococcus flavefaciens]